MNPDILLKVLGYAVVPLAMAWMGNHLASKVYDSEPKKRRMYRAAFTLLVIVGIGGTWLVESRADKSHSKEVGDQKQAIDELRGSITSSSIKNVGDMAYFKAKLEDAEKVNDKLSQFAPAILKPAAKRWKTPIAK